MSRGEVEGPSPPRASPNRLCGIGSMVRPVAVGRLPPIAQGKVTIARRASLVVMPSSRHSPRSLHSAGKAQAVRPFLYFWKEALSMSTKQSDLSAFGKAQTEGMLNLQKELL